MEWSNEKIIEFLQLYEKEDLLWNPRHPLHKDRNAVNDSWKVIEKHMNISTKELKKKKDNLLATYRKLHKKVQASTRTGSGSSEVLKPSWFAYELMEKFLHGIYMPTKTISSEETDCEVEKDCADNVNENDKEDNDVSGTKNNIDVDSSEGENETSSKCDDKFIIPTQSDTSKKRKISNTDRITNQMDKAFQILNNVADKTMKSNPPQKDQCALYAELLCIKLRNFDANLREIAMLEIDNLLFRLKKDYNQSLQQPHIYMRPDCMQYKSNFVQPNYPNTIPHPSTYINYHQHNSSNSSNVWPTPYSQQSSQSYSSQIQTSSTNQSSHSLSHSPQASNSPESYIYSHSSTSQSPHNTSQVDNISTNETNSQNEDCNLSNILSL